jgi:hypothetical protein
MFYGHHSGSELRVLEKDEKDQPDKPSGVMR